MNVFGAFELDISLGTSDDPACARIALQKATFDPSGRVFVTAKCLSLEELEGQINSLQDELDEIRERAPPSLPGRLKSMLLQIKPNDQS